MNFRHAIGFLLVGVLLNRLPHLAPAWCAANGVDGPSTREIWLQVMSAVQFGLGGWYLLRRLATGVAGLLAYTPPVPPELVADAMPVRMLGAAAKPRPVRVRPAIARLRSRPTLPLPEALDAVLLERPAA